MSHKIIVVFGQEQVNKIFEGAIFTNEEKEQFVKRFDFETLQEKEAFIKGMETASGWIDYFVIEENYLNFIEINS